MITARPALGPSTATDRIAAGSTGSVPSLVSSTVRRGRLGGQGRSAGSGAEGCSSAPRPSRAPTRVEHPEQPPERGVEVVLLDRARRPPPRPARAEGAAGPGISRSRPAARETVVS